MWTEYCRLGHIRLIYKMCSYTVLHSTTQYYIVLHSTTQYYTVLHSTTQYCTVLHSSIRTVLCKLGD